MFSAYIYLLFCAGLYNDYFPLIVYFIYILCENSSLTFNPTGRVGSEKDRKRWKEAAWAEDLPMDARKGRSPVLVGTMMWLPVEVLGGGGGKREPHRKNVPS